MTNFNERTNTLLYKNIYLSHFILERVDVGCVWEMSRRRWQTAILTQQYFFLILAGWLNRGSLRAQSPLSAAGSQLGILSPTDCFSKYQYSQPIASGHDVIHTPVPFTIWGLLWQLWLSYPLRPSVNCTQCLCTWTKSRILISPTLLNDKI